MRASSLTPSRRRPRSAQLIVTWRMRLVEALRVELLAHGADAGLARLHRLQLGVQLLLEVDDVQARRGRRRDVLDPERAVALVRARGQDGVEDVLGLRGARLRALDGSERTLLLIDVRQGTGMEIGQRRASRRDGRVRGGRTEPNLGALRPSPGLRGGEGRTFIVPVLIIARLSFVVVICEWAKGKSRQRSIASREGREDRRRVRRVLSPNRRLREEHRANAAKGVLTDWAASYLTSVLTGGIMAGCLLCPATERQVPRAGLSAFVRPCRVVSGRDSSD